MLASRMSSTQQSPKDDFPCGRDLSFSQEGGVIASCAVGVKLNPDSSFRAG